LVSDLIGLIYSLVFGFFAALLQGALPGEKFIEEDVEPDLNLTNNRAVSIRDFEVVKPISRGSYG
jgi:hypothetical protein